MAYNELKIHSAFSIYFSIASHWMEAKPGFAQQNRDRHETGL